MSDAFKRQLELLLTAGRTKAIEMVAFRLDGRIIGYGLQDGRHRLAAHQRAGRKWISAQVLDQVCDPRVFMVDSEHRQLLRPVSSGTAHILHSALEPDLIAELSRLGVPRRSPGGPFMEH